MIEERLVHLILAPLYGLHCLVESVPGYSEVGAVDAMVAADEE